MEFLNIVEEFVQEIAGKDAIKLLNLLKEKENISEFDIAEDLKMSINQIRNLLYKLNSYNLVYSNRKKDREKGWYIYYWTFNFKHARDLLISRKQAEILRLKDELEKERQHRYFVCANDNIRYELEEALELEYKCSECGSILKQEDSTKRINEIESRINKLQYDLSELNKPIMITPKAAEEEVEKKKQRRSKRIKKVKHKFKSKIKKKKTKSKPSKKHIKRKIKGKKKRR
ncbi:MAG: hypothetical protein AABW56_01745 [Nanoarchaeota archaeon]